MAPARVKFFCKTAVIFFVFAGFGARAEEVTVPEPAGTLVTAPRTSQKSKAIKRPRALENEGTEAKERFQSEQIIQSVYKKDGKSLEVDPD